KEIDLSFGSIMGFSGWVFASLSASTGNPTLALIISLITGLLAGLLNGILVAKVGLPSLIVTIGDGGHKRIVNIGEEKNFGGSNNK
ncbi:unnamed protein product, partial [marine sediment metagenome]